MRLSAAGLRRRQTKVLYPNHRLPPWRTEEDTGDRSNRLLDIATTGSFLPTGQILRDLLDGKKITPKTRLRPEVNAHPDIGSVAQMNCDSMYTIGRRNFSGENIREPYFYIHA